MLLYCSNAALVSVEGAQMVDVGVAKIILSER